MILTLGIVLMTVLQDLDMRGNLLPAPILSSELFDVIGNQLVPTAHFSIEKLLSLTNLRNNVASYHKCQL